MGSPSRDESSRGLEPPEGPWETTTSIGGRCRACKRYSRAVLRAREAWPVLKQTGPPKPKEHAGAHESLTDATPNPSIPGTLSHTYWPVAMAQGNHPIPSRTRKLSPAARMVLPGPPGGRVRRRQPSLLQRPSRSTTIGAGVALLVGGPSISWQHLGRGLTDGCREFILYGCHPNGGGLERRRETDEFAASRKRLTRLVYES